MNSLPKEKRDRIIWIAGGTLLAIFLLWYVPMRKQKASLEYWRKEVEGMVYQSWMADQKIKGAAKRQTWVDVPTRLEAAEKWLIPYDRRAIPEWLRNELQQFIDRQKHSVTLIKVDNSPHVDSKYLFLPRMDYSTVAFNVEIHALFHDFGKFLADFENQFPYMCVQDLTIWPLATSSAAQGRGTGSTGKGPQGKQLEKLGITMKVVVLYKPPP